MNNQPPQKQPNTPQNTPQKPQQGWVSALALADAYHIPAGTLNRILRACGVPCIRKQLTTPQGHKFTRTYYPATLYPYTRRK